MIFRLMRPGQSLRERNNRRLSTEAEYRCCFCLHVKTGTLLLGLWQVWVQLFIVSFLLAVVINPNLLACVRRAGGDASAAASPASQTTAATTTTTTTSVPSLSYTNGRHLVGASGQRHQQLRRQDHVLLLLIGVVSLLLALLMVAGALKERAKYLMPYFCMQLFDFIINCLTVVGYLSYLPDVKHWLVGHHWPHDTVARQYLLGLDDGTLGFLLLLVCMLYLVLKAYLLGMVWACYKYLVRKETGQLDTGADAATVSFDELEAMNDADCESAAALLLPPKYEDALKTPANLNAPPPYFPGNARQQE